MAEPPPDGPRSEEAAADATSSAGSEPHGGSRRHRILIGVGLVGIVVIALSATFAVLLSRVSTRPVTIDEARERAENEGQGSVGTTGAVAFRPEAGIYRYSGEGTESLDKPPTGQTQGPDIPGTVTHLEDDCWRLRVDYNVNHWQSWDYCPTDDGLVETAGAFFQRLDLVVADVETSSSYTCDPPVDAIRAEQRAGDEWMHECRGTSTGTEGEVVSRGPYTFVGPEELDIAGRQVDALHYRRLRDLTGGQTGTEDIHVWFDGESGLPLKNQRDIVVRSDSLIGGVTYEEHGSFALTSMTASR